MEISVYYILILQKITRVGPALKRGVVRSLQKGVSLSCMSSDLLKCEWNAKQGCPCSLLFLFTARGQRCSPIVVTVVNKSIHLQALTYYYYCIYREPLGVSSLLGIKVTWAVALVCLIAIIASVNLLLKR